MIKPCLLFFSCPGDGGDTTILWRGEVKKARKDDPYIKLLGALDTAIAYSHKAANILPRPQSRVMRLVGFTLTELGFYMTTGRAEYLDTATALYKRALKLMYAITSDAKLDGWLVCLSPECSTVDEARVWIRWTERRCVTLGETITAKMLNQLSNLAFEIMQTLPHMKYKHKKIR